MKPSQQIQSHTANGSHYSLGLVGFPLGHSLSPRIHLAALHALDLEGEYVLYPVSPSPKGLIELGALLDRVRCGQILGLNVTIPYKRTVIPLLDDLTPEAAAIGAVNTVFLQGSRLVGDNTDAPGFWADLTAQFKPRWFIGTRAIILGAGGSSRAVVYSLLVNGCTLTIAARRITQAEELRTHFINNHQQISIRDLKEIPLGSDGCSLIVNTTPLGMSPNITDCPWPADEPFPKDAAVYDLVYNPPVTLLVERARVAGLAAVTGYGMLIEQAALAFERWTGLEAPRQLMLESIK